MTEQIQIGDLVVDVTFKDIKNVHLSVHLPTGRVRISAPQRVSLDTLRVYVIAKKEWIKRHQTKMQAQTQYSPQQRTGQETARLPRIYRRP